MSGIVLRCTVVFLHRLISLIIASCIFKVRYLSNKYLITVFAILEVPHPLGTPCSQLDSIIRLMTVWRTTGKIIRTTVIVSYICKTLTSH